MLVYKTVERGTGSTADGCSRIRQWRGDARGQDGGERDRVGSEYSGFCSELPMPRSPVLELVLVLVHVPCYVLELVMFHV